MSKYAKLSNHLAGLRLSRWEASFQEIENVLGFRLPESAYKYQAWWANQAGSGHSQTAGWADAGWKTEDLDLDEQHVIFVNYNGDTPPPNAPATSKGLTIAQAKVGLASYFNVSPDMIEITIKG